jgi:hypothetical protein
MGSLEFKRIAFATEMLFETGRTEVDGVLVNDVAHGNEIEVITSDKKKEMKKLQSTMFICCDDFPPVANESVYKKLEVFKFQTTFVDQDLMDEKGSACPKHWRVKDYSIKEWINMPEVQDAFTKIVIDAYQEQVYPVPDSVKRETDRFKHVSGGDHMENIAEVVRYVDDDKSVCLVEEIQTVMREAGFFEYLSIRRIEMFIMDLYCGCDKPPCYGKYFKHGRRGCGFNRLVLR